MKKIKILLVVVLFIVAMLLSSKIAYGSNRIDFGNLKTGDILYPDDTIVFTGKNAAIEVVESGGVGFSTNNEKSSNYELVIENDTLDLAFGDASSWKVLSINETEELITIVVEPQFDLAFDEIVPGMDIETGMVVEIPELEGGKTVTFSTLGKTYVMNVEKSQRIGKMLEGQLESIWNLGKTELLHIEKWRVNIIGDSGENINIDFIPTLDTEYSELEEGMLLFNGEAIGYNANETTVKNIFIETTYGNGTSVHPDSFSPVIIGDNGKGDFEFWIEGVECWKVNKIEETETEITITFAPAYAVNIEETANGSIEIDSVWVTEGEEVVVYVEPLDGYVVKNIEISDKIEITTKEKDKKYLFIMPGKDVNLSVTFQEEYFERILENKENNVQLIGIVAPDAVLIVEKVDKIDEAFNELIKNKEILASFEVYVTGEYTGKLQLTFNVGEEYNDKTVAIFHKLKNNTIETFKVKVKEGKANIEVEELSPFVIAMEEETTTKELAKEEKGNPKTGDNIVVYFVLLIVAIIGIVGTFPIKRKK